MKFGYTIIYVPSVRDTLEFYQRAFGLSTRFCTDDANYGELEVGQGGTTLSFANETFAKTQLGAAEQSLFHLNRKDASPAAGAEISLVVEGDETVEDVYRKAIDAGGVGVKEPGTKPWGQTVAYVKDLNGFIVEICTSLG